MMNDQLDAMEFRLSNHVDQDVRARAQDVGQ